MDLKFAQMIVSAGQARDIDVELRDDYSGRGMMGTIAAAVVASRSAEFLAAAMWAAADADPDDAGPLIEAASRARADSLGRGLIYY